MTIASLIPEFIYQHIRYIIALAVFSALVAGWFFLKRSHGLIRSLRAVNWPVTDGRVEIVKVTAFGEQALAEIGYCYLVEGNRYSGYYTRQFGDEQHAWSYADSLRNQQVVVRYKRKYPKISALRSADQQSYIDLKGRGFLSSFVGGLLNHLRSSA